MKPNKTESVSKSGRRGILNKSKKSKNSDVELNSSSSRKKQRVDITSDEKLAKNNASDPGTTVIPPADEFKCIYCLSTTNRQGFSEELLVCKDCNARVHPSCTDMTEELARRASSSPWQCIDCKTCNVCNDSGDAEEMLICDSCDKGYHMNCHNPTVPEKPTGKWVCCQCVAEQEDSNVTEHSELANVATEAGKEVNSNTDVAAITCLPTPRASPVHFPSENTTKEPTTSTSKIDEIHAPARILPKLSETMVGEPPDASDWTPVEVAKFFHDMGFTEEALAFQNQEIDGRALLLMTRNDVLTGLDFRLGPALKIYAHVQRLQTRDHWLAVNK